jgi:methionyl-tRNA formyltransferase
MDAGPILAMRRTGPNPAETAEELHDRLAAIACDALDGAMKRLAANPSDPGDPQDESQATYAPKLTKADGRLDLAQSAIEVERRVNGLYSWPGARCLFLSAAGRSEEVVVARALAEDPAGAEPTPADRVGMITERGGILTGRGEIAFLEIKPAGARVMDWQSFVNGRHVEPGDRFVSLAE